LGRMADARKRAQQKGRGESSAGGAANPPTPSTPPPGEPAEVIPPAGGSSEAAHESMVFPAESPSSERSSRLTLPSSGLASEILALADSGALKTPASEPPPLPVATAPDASSADLALRSHNISFFAPAREERKAVEATEHLATFFLAGEEYGVDVRLVQEIIRVGEITQVPRAPEFIKGVINLRGRIIPVVDLRRKLGLGEVEATRQARVVVVKIRDRLIGLLVDGASQVLKVPVNSIEAAPEEVVEIEANYLRGVAKLETRLIILVDLHKILSVELREGGGAASA
jgi:purine-binding chemotaxis protein CheW